MSYKARGGSGYNGHVHRVSCGFGRKKSSPKTSLDSSKLNKNKNLEIVIDGSPYKLYDDGTHKIELYYDSNLPYEAEAKPYGKIYLGKKFVDTMRVSEKEANHVLIHELGHVLQAQQPITSTRENITTFEKHPIYRNNWFEGFAESFASYITGMNPTTDELQKKHSEYEKLYPQYYRLGRALKNAKINIITDD